MPEFRLAHSSDVPALLPLMQDFCSFEHLPFDAAQRTRLLEQLIADQQLGRLVLLQHQDRLVGYYVLGFGFSLEFGGRDAFIDELYVAPPHRDLGIGTAALHHAFELCRTVGVTCLHLEADHFNERAHQLYLRLGFKDHPRHLMSKWL